MRVSVQKSFSRYDHARRAIATLSGSGVGKSLLQRVGIAHCPQTRVGDDLRAVGLPGQDQATVDGLAIQQHGARAAIALFTAVLDVGITQVTQSLEQGHVRVQCDPVLSAVHVECYDFGLHRFPPDQGSKE